MKRYLFIIISAISANAFAQSLTRSQAVQTALQNNLLIKSAEDQVEYARQMKKTEVDFGNFSAQWMRGQYNTIETDNNLTFTQSIPFPTRLVAQSKLGQEKIIGSEKHLNVIQNNLAYEVKLVYEQLVYLQALHSLLQSQDSLYSEFARASAMRYKTGESNLLEKATAEAQLQELKNQLNQNGIDITIEQNKLMTLLKSPEPVFPADAFGKLYYNAMIDSISNPQVNYLIQQVTISQQVKRVERAGMLPALTFGYFNQSLIGFQNTQGQEVYYDKTKRFQGFQVGLSFPLWFAPQLARNKAAAFQEESTRKNAEYVQLTVSNEIDQTDRELKKNETSLAYYEGIALQNADLILLQARKAFRGGEIGYIEYLQSLRNAINIKTNYLTALNKYNQSVLKLEFLTGIL